MKGRGGGGGEQSKAPHVPISAQSVFFPYFCTFEEQRAKGKVQVFNLPSHSEGTWGSGDMDPFINISTE